MFCCDQPHSFKGDILCSFLLLGMVPWCLHGMLVTCFGRKNWRIEHSKVLYTPVSQPCSKRPVWVPFPLNANELLRAQPKDGICTAHFFPPVEDARTASCYYGNTWVWGRNGCRTTNCGATLYVRAGVSVGRLWVFFAGVSVSRVPKLQKLISGSLTGGGGGGGGGVLLAWSNFREIVHDLLASGRRC